MERKHNDLWVGGPWEQPERTVPPPPCSSRAPRPVLRVKKRRHPLLLPLILAAVIASLALAGYLVHRFSPASSFRIEFPPSVGEFPSFSYDPPDSARLPSEPKAPREAKGPKAVLSDRSGESESTARGIET